MQKIIFKTSHRKRLHFSYDGINPICNNPHKTNAEVIPAGTNKKNNCGNCVRKWTALKRKKRKSFLKSIGKTLDK